MRSIENISSDVAPQPNFLELGKPMNIIKSSRTRMINLKQTLGSLLPKVCKSRQQERTARSSHLPWPNVAKHARRLALAAILLSPLALVDLSYAAGRVFYDGFESGNTNHLGSRRLP